MKRNFRQFTFNYLSDQGIFWQLTQKNCSIIYILLHTCYFTLNSSETTPKFKAIACKFSYNFILYFRLIEEYVNKYMWLILNFTGCSTKYEPPSRYECGHGACGPSVLQPAATGNGCGRGGHGCPPAHRTTATQQQS